MNVGGRPPEIDGVPGLRPLVLLRDAGYEVHAVARGAPEGRVEVDGVSTWVQPSTAGVASRIGALRPELLFVESITYGVVMRPLARRSWIRNLLPAANHRVRRLQQAALGTFDAISFTNPDHKVRWRFNEDKHVDLAYPVDAGWWGAPVVRRDTWWTDRCRPVPAGPVLVSNAAYTRGKRLCELLEWLAPFLAENRGAALVFTGHQFVDPEVTEQLMTRPKLLGVDKQVLVTGWVSAAELRDLLAWASASIINSSSETQCLAVYESLAAGVPTLISAIPELTSQFPTLPSHKSGQELRANLERVLADQALPQQLVASTRERLTWADPARHDELFRTTLQQLLG